MEKFIFEGRSFIVDDDGFLINCGQWHETFARGLAPSLKIPDGLTKKHWKVINFIRDSFRVNGKCPLAYQTCRANKLSFRDLQQLFPTGYLRGACKLAGITYREGFHGFTSLSAAEPCTAPAASETAPTELGAVVPPPEKTYEVDVRGFLVDPEQWDEHFATNKAFEIGMQGGLNDSHWKVISFLRERVKRDGVVPTIYETCEVNNLDIEALERLFPTGYHRGAVKLAGLKAR